MQVKSEIILNQLGVTYSEGAESQLCPLHATTDPSLIVRTDDGGDVTFHCRHPQCGFNGDAVALVSTVRKTSLSDALNEFKTGALRAAIIGDADAQTSAYMDCHATQNTIKAYLGRCQYALRNNETGYHARSILEDRGLLNKSVQCLPESLGLLVRSELPAVLKEFEKPKYSGDYMVYPYTYGGTVTHINVQKLDDTVVPCQVFNVTRPDQGIFLEHTCRPRQSVMLAAPDEDLALSIYRIYINIQTCPPPVGVISGFPLPPQFAGYSEIIFLSTAKHYMSLTKALQLLNIREHVIGSGRRLAFKVCNYNTSHGNQLAFLNSLYNNYSSVSYSQGGDIDSSLERWIKDRILEFIRSDNDVEAVHHISAAGISKEAVDRFLTWLTSYSGRIPECDAIRKIMEQGISESHSAVLLANGHRVKQTPHALYAEIQSNNTLLSNVGINIKEHIITSDEVLCNCDIATCDAKLPVINVLIPRSQFDKAKKLQKIISREFLNRGYNPYVAIYERPGYLWSDIIECMGSGKAMRPEIKELGADTDLRINLPTMSIDTVTKEIKNQRHIFTLDKNMMGYYAGLRNIQEMEYKTVYRNIADQAVDGYTIGLAAGIINIMHHMAASLAAAKAGRHNEPRHLFFVESVKNDGQFILQQLMAVFAGADTAVRTLPVRRTDDYLDTGRQLGNLPLICRLPNMSLDHLYKTIIHSPISLMAAIDTKTAATLSGAANITFVTLNNDVGGVRLDDTTIITLQNTFAWLLLDFVSRYQDPTVYFNDASTPIVTTYQRLCELVAAEPQKAFVDAIRHYHVATDLTSLDSFFFMLDKVINMASLEANGIVMIDGSSGVDDVIKKANPPHIIKMKDKVLMHKRLIAALRIASHHTMLFSVEGIEEELRTSELLLPIDKKFRNYWAISIDTWNAHVVQIPQVLNAEDCALPLIRLA